MGGEFEVTDGGVCGPDNYIPLTEVQRIILVVVHYMTFVLCTWLLWEITNNFDVLRNRIWSPFLLMTGIIWLQIAAAFEIGNHYYINNFQLYEPVSDLINASFSFCNFGAQDLMALSLRKKGIPLCRSIEKPCNKSLVLNLTAMIADFLFIVLIPLRPILYAIVGRQASVTILSPLGAFAGIFSLFRLWFNLGPNNYTKWGGIGFFLLAMIGVAMNGVYRSTCIEAVHIGIGGSFVASVIPFTIAVRNAQNLPATSGPSDVEEGTTPTETTALPSNEHERLNENC